MTHRLISSVVIWCHNLCRLFSFIELVVKVTLIFSIIAAGYMDSRCLSIAAFLKEIDSFIQGGVDYSFTHS